MAPAAGVKSPSDRVPMMIPATVQQAPAMISDSFAKDAIIAWFRGEFAAANAIIDALCNHLTQLEGAAARGGGGGGGFDYEAVFAAIHRRRLNWIPVLQMQKYYSIADVSLELRRAAEEKKVKGAECEEEEAKKIEKIDVSVSPDEREKSQECSEEESMGSNENGGGEVVEEDSTRDDSPESEITDSGSQEVQLMLENLEIFSNDEDWEARRAQIKMTKGFVAKESVKGHMVNVVRGLKLYEDIFSDTELSKLTQYVNELHVAGQNGELSGETFIMYNQQSKGIKRELIQLGAPIFGQIKDEALSKCQKSHIEPIPAPLEEIIDHLIQWHLVSENRRPNSCIINYFDEGEYSQPFLKPPHLDQPISTLLLSESTMGFGRTLVCDSEGNYKGPLMLSLKEGSLLVMRGNSADMARHVMCQSSNRRVSITFFKVRSETTENTTNSSAISPLTRAMTLWQPGVPTPYTTPNGTLNGYEPMNVVPKWGVLRAPLLMLTPVRPMVLGPKQVPHGGTGVFLPWTVGSRKPQKHLPPRAQRGRLLALPPPTVAHKAEHSSNSSITVA